MAQSRLVRMYSSLIDRLSFSGELYKLRRDLNSRIDQPDAFEADSRSHPLGMARWFKHRRISIAEAYLTVVRDLDSRHSRSRLRALRSMIDASFHTQALDMPLNAARVQMALMKEAVKSRKDHRRQLELLQDFSASSRGRARTIKRLLDELDLVELPEEGKSLEELGVGFDTHVHDTGTSGRKNPTQLLIDAFIKGISELRVAYNRAASIEMMEEAIEAGRIVGIKVTIGIEIGVIFEGSRFHFMALLPEMRRGKDLRRFFAKNKRSLKSLLEGLEEDQEGRLDAIKRSLAAFNEQELPALNAGFPDRRVYRVPKLKMKDLAAIVPLESANRAHLGELLWPGYRSAMLHRVLYLKVKRGAAIRDERRGLIPKERLAALEARYAAVRREFESMNPDALRRRFFPDPPDADHASAFDDLSALRKGLSRAGCRLRLIDSLEHGLPRAIRLLDESAGLIDEVEVYNVKDCFGREGDEPIQLCAHIEDYNLRAAERGGPAIAAVLGSDSTGRNPEIPGMGFVRASSLRGRYRKRYEKRHYALPDAVSRLACGAGAAAGGDRILCMGKSSGAMKNRVGDDEDKAPGVIPLGRAIRYLNPAIVNLAFMIIGFTVADAFIGPFYAALWLAITGTRNALADLIAFRGATVRHWSAKNVDWSNVAQSLFWTGFSVPIMGFIKANFDVAWPLVLGSGVAASGLLFNAVKFFFIAFANGLYIASHNTLRGFDRRVIRANLFRTIISWPFATLTAPLGDLIGIPSIVQSKIWSDFVAGFVEGGQKYFKALRLRRRDVEEIVPRVLEEKKEERAVAVLDLLYLFREEPRMRNSLGAILTAPKEGAAPDKGAKAEEGAAAGAPLIHRLESVIEDSRLDGLLLDYALARHSEEAAADLAALIAGSLPEFRDWLSALSRSVARQSPALAVAQAAAKAAIKAG
jgi:hypothetical protein